MQASEWSRLEELYHAAIALETPQREEFLEQACADDPNLRRRLVSLISSDDATSFIEEAVGAAAHSLNKAGSLAAGERIGAYEVVEMLGEGGMGCIYLAERVDKEYRKQVAIKLVRTGARNPEILSRFRAERQILAHLDHPNIARLLDGGVTESGSPYVVMEYVDGVHIDEYVTSRDLSLEARLQLFRTVCSAISFAHRSLIIHRDIKPNNILVSTDGTVKLLDFGIAKLQEAGSLGVTAPLTRAAVRLFTPEYASPEQVRGQPVTTATDVYSLGALLYVLLTGVAPYHFSGLSPTHIEQTICETEPPKPSTIATRKGLSYDRKLAGDIDLIVSKAMHKDAARRYAGVDRLEEDIQRYLEGFPIRARPDTLFYRARKFSGRHRASVALAASALLLLIALPIATSIFARRVAHERDIAAEQRARAERISDFLIDLFKVSDPSPARANSITAREVLDRGADKVSRELATQPKAKAAMLDTLAEVYRNLGLLQRSESLFESSLETRQRTEMPGDPELAQSELNVARTLFLESRDYTRVESLARHSLETSRKRFGENSKEVADCLNVLGNLAEIRANFDQAQRLLQQTYEIRKLLFGENNLQTADALFDLANLEYERDNSDAAEALFQRTLTIREKLLDPNDPAVLAALEPVGYLLQRKGDFIGAESAFRRVLAGRRKMTPAPNASIATGLDHLASLLQAKDVHAPVEPLYLEALDNDRKSLGEWNLSTAVIVNNYAEWLRTQDRFPAAERGFRECAAIYAKVLSEDHPYIATAYDNLAMTLLSERRNAEAEQFEVQSLAMRRNKFGEMNGSVARSLNHLGRIREERGKTADAEQLFEEAFNVSHKSAKADASIRSTAAFSLGALLTRTGHSRQAEPLLREAFATRQHIFGADAWQTAEAESILGGCLYNLHRYSEAQPHLVHGYEELRAKRGDRFESTLRARNLLAADSQSTAALATPAQ